MKIKLLAAATLLLLLSITSCRKDTGELDYKNGNVTVRMTDAPSPYGYEEVNIDVHDVQVHIGGSTGGDWYKLHTRAGIYNVLQFCNGLDTLLVNENVPTGEITAVRLNLGTNNSLRKNGTLYPLPIPPGQDAGLTFEIFEKITDHNQLNLILDFDAGQSVIEDGHNGYHLQPVVRAFTGAHTGNVSGIVDVPQMGVAFTFNNGRESYTTYANPTSGQFLIRGLKPAMYMVTIYTASGQTVVYDIEVDENHTTDLGLIHVH